MFRGSREKRKLNGQAGDFRVHKLRMAALVYFWATPICAPFRDPAIAVPFPKSLFSWLVTCHVVN
jgi:hypothetical protein